MSCEIGGRIAFSRCLPDVGEQIFTTGAAGSDARQLTCGGMSGESWSPVWSPEGRHLCFVSRRDHYSSLYLMDADGAGERRLTKASGTDDDFPTWSPDGQRIAFARGNAGGADTLIVLDLASHIERLLTEGHRLDSSPSWSPDGGWIVFRRALAPVSGLHVVPAGGGEVRFLVPGRAPAWSPSGEWIAYAHGGLIWALPVTEDAQPAGPMRQLTGDPRVEDRHPSWYPDGSLLVYESVLAESGEGRQRLRVITAAAEPVRDLGEGHDPDWGPARPLADHEPLMQRGREGMIDVYTVREGQPSEEE